MLYPENIGDNLGFDRIKNMLAAYCLSSMGRECVEQMHWSGETATVQRWLGQVEECMRLLNTDKPLPAEGYHDARPWLKKGMIDGSWLSMEEFHYLRALLKTMQQVADYFAKKKEQYPLLAALMQQVNVQPEYVREIDRRIDDKGQLKPSASPELYSLTHQIDQQRQQVRKVVNAIARQAAENEWSAENAPVLRDGRLTIALYVEHKRKINGFTLDESSTGQTVYVEPAEVLEGGNRLRELELERQREMRRILIQLTTLLRPQFEQISLWCGRLGMLDFVQAKARLGIALNGCCPTLLPRPGMEWINARHPLLFLHLKKLNKEIVPLTFRLDKDERICVISGPNAGGKSVLLKTVGLLQLMVQHGLPVPCSAGSGTGIFEHLMADIGDQQNLDNDLSTYSSHLTNMRHMMHHANSRTLLLIDEFGTGTDPQFGGPMAESVLEFLNRKFCFGVVTTHYSQLKLLAGNTHGVFNGSMAFDQKALQPLYHYKAGLPGSSYTFEIAKQTGIAKEITDKARQKAGSNHSKVDKLLLELEREKTYLKNLKADTEKMAKQAAENLATHTRLKNELEKAEKELMRKAKTEAKQLLTNARQLVEKTIREIKEANAESVATKAARQKLDMLEHELTSDLKKPDQPATAQLTNWKTGDRVQLSTGQTAELLGVSGKKATVLLGNLRTVVKLSDVLPLPADEPLEKSTERRAGGIDLNEKLAHFNAEINVIGKRSEEALPEVVRFVDEALMLGFDRIRIVHGRGSGILKRMVRNELKHIAAVKNIADEQQEFGGDAITVIELA